MSNFLITPRATEKAFAQSQNGTYVFVVPDTMNKQQIADAVASSFFFGLELTRQGFTEPRYVQLLNPKLYRKKTRVMGFGLKIWPKESFSALSQESQLGWISQLFQ